MADIRISNTGGNFSATTTWDGGVVPGTNDVVSGDTNSGQLTLTDNRTVQRLEMSGYSQTFTLNAGTTIITSLASATNRFGSGMSFAGTGTYQYNNSNGQIYSTTTSRIPTLDSRQNMTLQSDLYVNNFTTNSNSNYTGAGLRVYVNGNLTQASPSGGIGGTAIFTHDGTGTITAPANLNGFRNGITLEINSTGTTTFASLTMVRPFTLRYVAGTVVASSALQFRYGALSTNTINLELGNAFSATTIAFNTSDSGSASQSFLDLRGNNTFGTFVVRKPQTIDNYMEIRISGQTGTTNTFTQLQLAESDFKGTYLAFTPTSTYNITRLFSMGSPLFTGFTPPSLCVIKSNTPGTKAIVNIGDNKNSPVFYTAFTDINNSSGQALKTWNGTVSNCDNITVYSTDIFPASTGGGGGSFTFVN